MNLAADSPECPVKDSTYWFGYRLGLDSLHPKKETLGHWLTLRREHAWRWVKNWRYHLLRQLRELSAAEKSRIEAMGRGFDAAPQGPAPHRFGVPGPGTAAESKAFAEASVAQYRRWAWETYFRHVVKP